MTLWLSSTIQGGAGGSGSAGSAGSAGGAGGAGGAGQMNLHVVKIQKSMS